MGFNAANDSCGMTILKQRKGYKNEKIENTMNAPYIELVIHNDSTCI